MVNNELKNAVRIFFGVTCSIILLSKLVCYWPIISVGC